MFWAFFVGALLLILLMTLLGWLYLLWYRRKFTRERFAFFLLTNYTSIVVLFFNYVLAPDYLATAINYVLVEILHGKELQLERPDFVVIIAVSIIIISYFKTTFNIFRNWNGGKSVEEIENTYGNRNASLFINSLHFISNHKSRELGIEENKDIEGTVSYEQMEVENLVWHIQAAELLRLKDTQYKIDIDKDWYSQENCYITNYGSNGQIVAILCSNKIVSDAKILSFLKFVKGQTKERDNIRYILAIQDNIGHQERHIDGYTIEIITENYLYETIIDFEDYKRDIVHRFAENEIYQGYGLTINDIYVEPQCTVYDVVQRKRECVDSIENYIAEWMNDNSQHKQLALLGEYGQGKSVLSLRLAYQILTGKIKSERIPIIIELRGRYVKQYGDTKEILYSWANRYNIQPKALMKLHYAGRLLLIFEGFDELDLIGGEEIRKEHFRKLWEYSIPKSKIIITGRPNYFMDDKEMTTLLRLSQQRADSSKYCETIHLEPFKREQIYVAMRSIKKNVKDEILNVYDNEAKNSSFCDLVSRPSLLFLTGLIWEKEQLASKISNINSAEVIRAFLTYSYKRQDEKSGNSIMNSDERAYFMQGIAVAIVSRHGYTNQIGRKELEDIVGRLFRSFPDEITYQSGSANKRLLKNRLDESHLLQAINTDIRSCGVLVKDYSSEDTFCFAHKSFLETLIAEFTAESFVMEKEKSGKFLNFKKVLTISNTLRVDYNDSIFLNNENIFKFVVELLTTKVEIKGEENSKERVRSIYKQLHLYPFSLWLLGCFISILGSSFTLKSYRIYYLVLLFVLPIYVFLLIGFSLKALFIALAMMVLMLFYYIIGNRLIYTKVIKAKKPTEKRKSKNILLMRSLFRLMYFVMRGTHSLSKMRDLKVIAFYLVCKNLKADQALNKIWPTHVVSIVERMAQNVIRR